MRNAVLFMTLFVCLASVVALADPILTSDGSPLAVDDPGIGRLIISTPGSTWDVWGNDNWGNTSPGVNGDFDFNDGGVSIFFGESGQAQWLGALAADTTQFLIGGLPLGRNTGPVEFTYVPDQELVIQFQDLSTGSVYVSGPGDRNPDGAPHVWTGQEAPEPATWTLSLVGMAAFLGAWRMRR